MGEDPKSIRLTSSQFAGIFKACHGVTEIDGRVVADEEAIRNGAWRGFNWSTVRVDEKNDHLVVIQSVGTIQTDPRTGEIIVTPCDNLISQLLFKHMLEVVAAGARPKVEPVHAQAPA